MAVSMDLPAAAGMVAERKARRAIVEDRLFHGLTLASAVFVVVMLLGVMGLLAFAFWSWGS